MGKNRKKTHKLYKPDFPGEKWSARDRFFLEPFVSNLDGFTAVLRNLPPEIVGALCSRASRARGSLLRVLLNEYIYPIVDGEDKKLASEFEATVKFLRKGGFKDILNNQRAQAFYAKWLSQFGDDSIAQLTGTHVVFWGISQIAMKFIEDQRVGIEPMEKSTRYVNFSEKINGHYLYYTPRPDLKKLGFLRKYRETLDYLFRVYSELIPVLTEWLKNNYDAEESVLEKKSFDCLRGLLPMATLGQLALRGNAQSFEYLINRTAKHHLGELRWISESLTRELNQEIPSLLLKLEDEKSHEYQDYLSRKRHHSFWRDAIKNTPFLTQAPKPQVRLLEYDSSAEDKIIAAILFSQTHSEWDKIFETVCRLSYRKKEQILNQYFFGRTSRWQKVGRALENSYLRFEITMNIGAYRDLHRHRMHTQERQFFSCYHGYDIPPEIAEAGIQNPFCAALDKAGDLFNILHKKDPILAQYVVPLAYRMRFYQWQNFRQLFWETELRTIAQGHPDYRFIEQKKFRLVKEKFPLIAEFMMVDTEDYPFPRRDAEEKIKQKEKKILESLRSKK